MAKKTNKDLYVVFGEGDIPKRELRDALDDVFPDVEESLSLVLIATSEDSLPTLRRIADRDEIHDAVVFYDEEAVSQDALTEVFDEDTADDYIPFRDTEDDVADALSLEGFDHGEALVLLSSDDGSKEPEWTKTLLEATSLDGSYRIRALNKQLFDINYAENSEEKVPAKRKLKSDKAPKVEEPEETPIPAELPDLRAMTKMSRNEIKKLGKDLKVQPTDWRSKDSIIDAILEAYGGGVPEEKGSPEKDPEEEVEQLKKDLKEVQDEKSMEERLESGEMVEATYAVDVAAQIDWNVSIPGAGHVTVTGWASGSDPMGVSAVKQALTTALELITEEDPF